MEANSDWRVLRIISPAGTWYISRTHDDAKKLSSGGRKNKDGDKEPRAVFFREELSSILKTVEKLSSEDRQAWLKEIITIKKAMGLATVTKLQTKSAKKSFMN